MNIINEIFSRPILRGKIRAIKSPELQLESSTISNSFSVTDSLHFTREFDGGKLETFCVTVNRNSYTPNTYFVYLAGQPLAFENLDEIDQFIEEHYPNIYRILKKRFLEVL